MSNDRKAIPESGRNYGLAVKRPFLKRSVSRG